MSIEGGRIFLDISIAFLKGQHLSQAAKAFLDMLGKIAPKLGPDQGIRAIVGETSPQL